MRIEQAAPKAVPRTHGASAHARYARLLALGMLCCVACGGGGSGGGRQSIIDGSPEPNATASPVPTPGLRLLWNDEFDGANGDPVDSTKWSAQVGGDGWGQFVADYKTNCTDPSAPNFTTSNAHLDGSGNLVLSARREAVPYATCWYGPCEYTSALLVTANTLQRRYGRYEIRMKTPPGRGLWPAFWLASADLTAELWGEIDIAEMNGRWQDTIFQAAHGPGFIGEHVSESYTVRDGIVADEFHTYAVDWRPQELRFYIDSRLAATITPESLPREGIWPFDAQPYHMVLDLAVGTERSWSEEPDSRTPFPAEVLVDYVRVYELD